MINVIVIDDEPLARRVVLEYLQLYPQITVVAECNDGFEGAKAIALHQPELVFLDIQMPRINGFEMLELLTDPPAIIFTTAFDEYALKAFETHAIDYLLKPFSKERFCKAVDNWLAQARDEAGNKAALMLENTAASPAQHERVVVKTNGKIKVIPVQDILFFEAADDYVKVCTTEGSFLKNKTLAYFDNVLDENHFVRTHRSYLVNVSEITRIEPYEKENYLVILKNSARVPVSKAGYAKLKAVLGL